MPMAIVPWVVQLDQSLLSLFILRGLPPLLPSPTPLAPLPLPPTSHHNPSTPNKQSSVMTLTVGPVATLTLNNI